MSQQLLHYFHILTIALENRGKCVSKGVPRHLLLDAQLSGHRLNVVAHHRAQPDGLLPALGSSTEIGLESASNQENTRPTQRRMNPLFTSDGGLGSVPQR